MESSGENMPPPQPQAPQPAQRSALPTAGGVLLLIAGIISLIFWIFVVIGFAAIGAMSAVVPIAGFAGAIMIVCGVVEIIFSIIALLGGVMAIQRKMWGLALAGSILGLFTFGYFITSILSLVALILIALSKSEFQ